MRDSRYVRSLYTQREAFSYQYHYADGPRGFWSATRLDSESLSSKFPAATCLAVAVDDAALQGLIFYSNSTGTGGHIRLGGSNDRIWLTGERLRVPLKVFINRQHPTDVAASTQQSRLPLDGPVSRLVVIAAAAAAAVVSL